MLVWAQYDGCPARDVNLEVVGPLVHLVWVGLEPKVMRTIKSLETTKALLIGLEQDEVIRCPVGTDWVVLV